MTNAGKTPGRSGVYEGGRLTRSRRRTRLWLIASGTVMLLLFIGIQTVLLDRVVIAGRDFGSPGLCLCFVMAMGYLVDRETGGLAGLACGFLLDGACGCDMMLRPVVYFLLGWLCGVLGDRLLAHNAPSFAVYTAVGALADAARAAAAAYFAGGSLPPASWIVRTQLLSVPLTVVCAFPVYAAVRAVINRIKK